MGLNDQQEKINYAKNIISTKNPDRDILAYQAAYEFLSSLLDDDIEEWLIDNIRYGKWWEYVR